MSLPLTIRKVENSRDFRAFFEFPWQLYKNDLNWVPPLKSMRRGLLDKAKNPDWKYLEGDYFVARRDNQIVGTIAAFINHRHNQTNHDHIGWFGAFEVCDDQEAALALLNTASNWVQTRGYEAIAGPQTFTNTVIAGFWSTVSYARHCGCLITNLIISTCWKLPVFKKRKTCTASVWTGSR